MKSLSLIAVALCGYAGAGKDTVADLLVAHSNFRKLAFADAVRAEICTAFGIDSSFLTRQETKSHPITALALSRCMDPAFVARMVQVHPRLERQALLDMAAPRSPRQIMQWWGTEYRRADDALYWVKRMDQRLCNLFIREGVRRVVLTDCRFANEVAYAREHHKAPLWQVKRPAAEHAAAVDERHTSANDGSQFGPDYIMNNDRDIGHLHMLTLDALYKHLGVHATSGSHESYEVVE